MSWTYTLDDLAWAIAARIPDVHETFQRISTDTRTIEPGDVFFALSGANFDGNRFVGDAFAKGACAAVTTTQHPDGTCLLVPDPLAALQQFASHHRSRHQIPILALTGSCGKTSSKDMIAAVLATKHSVVKTQGNLNNDIGCPLSLLSIDATASMAVIEMGANHMGEIASLCRIARPTEAAITMIAPAHLEGFGSVENVAKAKGEIVEALAADGVFYVNTDDPRCVKIADAFDGKKIGFGSNGSVRAKSARFVAPCEMELDIDPVGRMTLPLACRAHVSNVLLAIAVGLEHGVTEFETPLREAALASSRFKVLKAGPLTIIDDSYNANPASMASSLQALVEWPGPGARMAALGDMLELGEAAASLHRELGALAQSLGVTHLFAKGPHACDTIAGAEAIPVAQAFDEPRALAQAIHDLAQPGDLLLVKGSRSMRMEQVIDALREIE